MNGCRDCAKLTGGDCGRHQQLPLRVTEIHFTPVVTDPDGTSHWNRAPRHEEWRSMRFRKKPVVIEAFQWFPEMGEVGGVKRIDPSLPPKARYLIEGGSVRSEWWIETLEGAHVVSPGDWIITGVKGETYPCKPDIFKVTYEHEDGTPVRAPG